jgi:hypothetical protein
MHKFISRLKSHILRRLRKLGHKSLLLQGRLASFQVRERTSISSLHDVEFSVLSQWGEDGIIDWLIERLALPPQLQSFIEFGVERYDEANTRFLLENRNWRGLIMDGDPQLRATLQRQDIYSKYDLRAVSAFITRENINQLILDAGYAGEIGLLSVDIDGNDYWVWEAITAVEPVLVICEYNAVFGDIWPISVPYDPQFQRADKHFSHLYFGASIMALRSLAKQKGYAFLGTNLAGNDAFFVREDCALPLKDAIATRTTDLSRFRESHDTAGQLTFLNGDRRLETILDMPVVNVETGETQLIRDLSTMYSEAWSR